MPINNTKLKRIEMKHSIKIFALLAIFLAPAFVACDDDDDKLIISESKVYGLWYVDKVTTKITYKQAEAGQSQTLIDEPVATIEFLADGTGVSKNYEGENTTEVDFVWHLEGKNIFFQFDVDETTIPGGGGGNFEFSYDDFTKFSNIGLTIIELDNDDFEAQYSANYPSAPVIVSMVLELDRNPDLD